jgi:hypothetical protein
MTAKELFEAYESAYPDRNLKRLWKETTERERAQWEAVAMAVRDRLRPLLINRVEKFKAGDVVVHTILGNHGVEDLCDICAVI